MAVLGELWIDRAGRGLAPDDAMLLESVLEAIRRMQEIRAEHPGSIFRFLPRSSTRAHEVDDLFRRASEAALALQLIPPEPDEDPRRAED